MFGLLLRGECVEVVLLVKVGMIIVNWIFMLLLFLDAGGPVKPPKTPSPGACKY